TAAPTKKGEGRNAVPGATPDSERSEKGEEKATPADSKSGKDDTETEGAKNDDSNDHGVIVRAVYAGSPAADAGVQAGDRILSIDETRIKSIDDAIRAMNNMTPEAKLDVKVAR